VSVDGLQRSTRGLLTPVNSDELLRSCDSDSLKFSAGRKQSAVVSK